LVSSAVLRAGRPRRRSAAHATLRAAYPRAGGSGRRPVRHATRSPSARCRAVVAEAGGRVRAIAIGSASLTLPKATHHLSARQARRNRSVKRVKCTALRPGRAVRCLAREEILRKGELVGGELDRCGREWSGRPARGEPGWRHAPCDGAQRRVRRAGLIGLLRRDAPKLPPGIHPKVEGTKRE
jgi:hypothetical protein